MSKKVVRTVAFQIDDWDFLKEYDQRQQDSGLSVKNYFISLIKADIAMHQTQKESPTQNDGSQTDVGVEQAADIASQQKETETETEATPEQTADELSEDAAAEDQEQASERQPGFEEWSEPATPENAPDNPGVPSDDVDAYLPKPDQTDAPEEMMNLFVKIPKDQREALNAHILKTGETAGKVLNRLIDDFLDNTESLPDGFEEAYKRYSENVKDCNTNWSAKIPVRVNEELTEYLNSFGGSRNALMASLVELELKGQELAETQDENQGMSMM